MDAAIEQHSESFQCPVCYELISSRHKSRVLPCGHGNVCEKDLATLWRQAQHSHAPLKCPSQGCALPDCPSVDRLPYVPCIIYACLFCNVCGRYNWALISAGDTLEDLLAARRTSSTFLSGPSKRAMQLVDSICNATSSSAAHVVHIAHAVYCSLTQSYSASDPDVGHPTKPKIGDVSTRQLQEAEARIAVLKKIIGSQGLPAVFLKL
jgi:hypothetical protein